MRRPPHRTLVARIAFALVACLSALAHAGGFELYDQSPTATALGGAVSARGDDPSMIFYNPAAIAPSDRGSALLGATLTLERGLARTLPAPTVSAATVGDPTIAPTLFVAARIGRRLTAGLGLFSQFGANYHFSDGTTVDAVGQSKLLPFPGRFVATDTQLATLTINPTVAFRPNETVSFGAGLDVVLASLELDRALAIGDFEGSVKLGGTTAGIGMNIGLLMQVVPQRLSAALAYRTQVDLRFDLKSAFTAPPELSALFYDPSGHAVHGRTSIALPHNFTFGLATSITRRVSVTTDLHFTLWSDLDAITVTFPNSRLSSLRSEERWRDSWSTRVGVEYRPTGALTVRVGLGYDLTPVPATTLGPFLPEGDRILLSGGLGYTWRGFGLGFGYSAAISTDRISARADLPAVYSSSTSTFSLAASYQWAAPSWCRCAKSDGSSNGRL